MYTDPYIKNFFLELTARPRAETLSSSIFNVRWTCADLVNSPECLVRVNEERVTTFIEELDSEAIKRSSHLMQTALEFPDIQTEISFHVTLHLFNFGHGYRHPLHEVCGMGAWQTMKRGIESLHAFAARGCIDSEALLNLTEGKINELFRFPPEGSSSSANQIAPLRKMIMGVAHSTGRRLHELGYQTFAEFIFGHQNTIEQGKPSGIQLVEALADNFPPFDDRRNLPGGEVLFLKKSQLAIAELYQRLGSSHREYFNFGDIKDLTVACDNVLPCVLRSLGILDLDPELARKIDTREPLPAGFEEAQLRAAAITAAEMILKEAQGSFWSKELGDYLWTLGKDPRFRKVERHATLDTCFY